jgi:cytochrome c-type biogenesis protein CcsB
MSTFSMVLLVAALVAYGISTALFIAHLLSKKAALAMTGERVLIAGLIPHAIGKVVRFAAIGTLPVTDSLEALNLLALIMGLVFVFVARRYGVPVLGAFSTPLCLVTLAASLAFGSFDGSVPEALRSAWFPVHLGFAITADAFFLVAGGTAVAYLVQERQLRRKALTSPLFRKMPPLHVLDEIVHRMVIGGFAFLSMGIAAGMFFAKDKWGAYWSWDPKQVQALITWLLFAAILHARLTVGWQGRRVAYMTIGSVVFVLVAFVLLDRFTTSKHGGEYVYVPVPVDVAPATGALEVPT